MRFQVTRRSLDLHLVEELTILAAPELFFTQAVIVDPEALEPALSAAPAITSPVASAVSAPTVTSRARPLPPAPPPSPPPGSISKCTPSPGSSRTRWSRRSRSSYLGPTPHH